MQNQDYTSSTDFLKRFFGETFQDIELRACSNDRSSGAVSVFGRDVAKMDTFLRKQDRIGWGMYFGLCTRADVRKDGGARSGAKDAVAECPGLWVDIDCAKQGIAGDEAIRALEFLPHPPTIIINSGGGLHAYWLLEEPVDVTPGQVVRDTIEAALRQLALILAGDTSCAELARILRLPGTLNSKDATLALNNGEPALCEILSDTGRVYDLESLCEWLSEQRPILHGKVEAVRAAPAGDPFLEYALKAGYSPAVDIDADLAAMNHEASGDNSVHKTQLRVSMSMIARGYEDDAIVDRVIAATERAAPRDKPWNWSREERKVRDMIRTGRGKASTRERPAPAAPLVTEGNLAVVHDMQEERAKRQPKPRSATREVDQITALGTAVLEVWQDRHGPIIHSRGTSYVYEDGVWAVWDDQHDQMLRIMMQEACGSLGMAPKTSLIGAATLFFSNRPSLLIRDARFDEHSLIVAGDGVVDPTNGEIGEHSADLRAMFKVGANLAGKRECPAFLQFLEESFADKDPDEIPDIIRTVQEWFGACLVANKSRSLCKGLLVHGGSRTGKTQLSEVLRALLGRGQTSATSAGDIGTDFGLQGFLGKRGWVADDAIGQDEYLDAERYKKIVTGEEVGVRRKNRTDIMARFGFPVMLTANHLPKIKDQSDAVYNRSLVLQMTNVRPESKPEPAGYHSISAKVIAEELTGVLWWAIEGWQRLSARGIFTEPACMKRAVGEMQNNNNQVGSWLKECAVADPENKVANADLFASFAGWYYQENGDGKFPWSQNGFIRRLKEAMPNLGYQKGVKTRNLTGIRLTEDGLEYWSVNDSRDHPACPKSASLDSFSVNQGFSISHSDRIRSTEIVAPEDRTPRF